MKWSNEQLEAIYKDGCNILVSAGAGSGKTAVLSERVLKKIEDKKAHINELLILTFTNAAAEEMKDRIRKKLAQNDALKEELDLLDLSYITTFDSFALSILKKYAYKLNLDNNISVLDEVILNYYKEIFINDIFDKLYEERDSEFLSFIKSFCLKDDKEVKQSILALHSKTTLLADENQYFEEFINNYNFKFEDYYQKLNEYFINKKNILIKKSYDINDLLSKDISEEILFYQSKNAINDILSFTMIKIPKIKSGLSDDEKALKEKYVKEVKDLNKELLDFVDKEKTKLEYLDSLNYIKVIIRILKKLNILIRNFEIKNNAFTFTSIAKLGIKLLKENEDVRQVEARFKEIMVDEYQDTSDLQEEFLSLIVNNNLYMVGDIKQSIYGFRNANPLLFKTKYNNYKEAKGGIKIDLNNNFRSRKEVTKAINELFNEIMTDEYGGADYVNDHQIVSANSAYFSSSSDKYNLEILAYEDSEYKNNEVEIYTIAKDIKAKIESGFEILDKDTSKLRKCEYKDITILLDRTSDFDKYKEIFTRLNIPLFKNADTDIKDNILYLIIKNIFILLKNYKENKYNKSFNYAYTSVARSFLFEKRDDDIYKEIKSSNYDFNILNLFNAIDYADDDIYTTYNKIINNFKIYEKLSLIGNVNEAISIITYLANLTKSLASLSFSLKSFPLFLDYMVSNDVEVKMKPLVDSLNSVSITNIHKSKGLEYPICYFSGFTKSFNIRDLNTKFIFDKEFGFIVPSTNNKKYKYNLLKLIYKEKYLKDNLSEEIRKFYVALTRARDKMIFLYKKDEERKDIEYVNRYNDFINHNPLYKEYLKDIDINSLNIGISLFNKINIPKSNDKISVYNLNKEYNLLAIKKASKNTKLFTKEEQKLLDKGKYVHELFEYLDFNNPNFEILSKEDKLLVEPFFNQGINFKDAKIYKEYEFIIEEDEITSGVIDLMLEYDDYIMIVDYKLKNTKDDDYLKQLKIYKDYIAGITNKRVICYLYSVMTEKMEELNI